MKTAVLLKDGVRLVETVEIADDLVGRMVGLLGRSKLGEQRAMYLSPCSSIHTFFMRFPIDLVFLNREMVATRIVRDVRPWRTVFGGAGAVSVLEMESGWFPADAVSIGDTVKLVVA